MAGKRQVEIFTAGSPACKKVIRMVHRIACDSCEVTVLDMREPETFRRARDLGVKSIPAVAVDGKLVRAFSDDGPEEGNLRAAGIGKPNE